MSDTLYRKYRPQTFAQIAGQGHITTVLKNQLINKKIAHAYLFCGIRGIGKTTVARLLAKSLNCLNRPPDQYEPCNDCESCRAITQGTSLDVLEIDAASNRRIDDIRELKEHIPYGPARDTYRVVIVDEVHMLTTEAFNALLKTLEEPPKHVIFILATTEAYKLPTTIISRCQRFDFHNLTKQELIDRLENITNLEKVKADHEVLEQIAELASGSSRDAENILGKLISTGEQHITKEISKILLPQVDQYEAVNLLEYIIKKQTATAIDLIQTFIEKGGNPDLLSTKILDLLRQIMLVKLANSHTAPTNNGRQPDQLIKLANEISLRRIRNLIETWLKVEQNTKTTEIISLPLELAVLEACEDEIANEITKPIIKSNDDKFFIKNENNNGAKLETALTSGNPNLKEIEQQWPELVNTLKPINHSLSFIMSVARPTKIENKTLTIGFQYKLHYERINEPKIRKIVDDTLSKIIGTQLTITPILDQTPPESGDLFSSVLTVFSGRVID